MKFRKYFAKVCPLVEQNNICNVATKGKDKNNAILLSCIFTKHELRVTVVTDIYDFQAPLQKFYGTHPIYW